MNYIILTSFILKDESTLSLRGIRYEIQSHAVTCRYRCQGFQVIRVASQACQMSITYCTIMYIEKVVTKRKYLHFRSYSIYRYDSPDVYTYVRYFSSNDLSNKIACWFKKIQNHYKGCYLPCFDIKKRKGNFYTVSFSNFY